MILHRVIALLIGYCFGNIPFGLLFARFKHVDLRHEGSGNIGSTNVARSVGFKTGILTLLCDCLKAVVPAIIVTLIFGSFYVGSVRFLACYAAFGAVMGHIFPAVLSFKGGKGIATSAGLILVAAPIAIVPCLIGFLASVIITRYVSLGSLVCAIILPVEICIMAYLGVMDYPYNLGLEVAVLFVIDASICAYKHRDNIRRLIAKEENKFTFKKEKK